MSSRQESGREAVMLYDGDCGLCEWTARRLARRGVTWRPWQGEPTLPAGITTKQLDQGVLLLLPDGRRRQGFLALRALAWRVPWLLPLAALALLPGVSHLGRAAYRLVATRRARISARLGLRSCRVRAPVSLVVVALSLLSANTVGAAISPPTEATWRGERQPALAMPFVRPGEGFAVVTDTTGAAAAILPEGLTAITETWWARTQPWPDADVVVVFTTRRNDQFLGLYRPLANDIDGIGYGAVTGGPEAFDLSPDGTSGFVYANAVDLYIEYPTLLPLVVLQELGHRWCCYLREGFGDADDTELLGRTDGHWSYFLDTGGSPMEGNAWSWDGATTFTSRTAAVYAANDLATPFSPLDLYVMGLVPANAVPPSFLIRTPDASGQTDFFGNPILSTSPPEFAHDVTISGERHDVTTTGVIAVNGARAPTSWDGDYRIAFLLVVQPGEEEDQTLRTQMAYTVSRAQEIWASATGGRSALRNMTLPRVGGAGEPCDGETRLCADGLACGQGEAGRTCTVPCGETCDDPPPGEVPPPEEDGGCRLGGGRGATGPGAAALLALLLLFLARLRCR